MLNKSIEYLKGVGTAKADILKKELGIFSYIQLLQHYPYRYVDKTKFHQIKDVVQEGEYVQIKGILRRIQTIGEGRKRRMTGVFRDETGFMELTWFKGLSWVQNLQVGVEYIVYGKPTVYKGNISMVHPEITLLSEAKKANAPTLEPLYSTTEKMRTKRLDTKGLLNIMRNLFIQLHPQRNHIPETLPDYLIKNLRLPSRYNAWIGIHFPRNKRQCEQAQRRIKFEEFFFLQLRMLHTKHQKKQGIKGFVFPKIGNYFQHFYDNNLQFELTNAQKRVIKEIRADMATGQQMNRLLQGDVGSGKTIVAFMSLLIALDNGFQTALMAPTEILAQQHYQSLLEMGKGLDINIEILTGTIKGKRRKDILQRLQNGEIHLLIGTHALIEDPVIFKNLGFVIVDEQHRFGVVQRARMWRKNPINPPHILVMTATPIPRTLAMTAYGDLDVSVIDEMPPGRKPINTFHKYESQRLWTFGRMKEEIAKGHQVYVVYPLIEESSYDGLADVKDLMEGYATMEREFPKPQYQISVVHGRQKPADKEALSSLKTSEGRLVSERITELVGKIGEKIEILAYERFSGDKVVDYIHSNGKLGVLVALKNVGGEAEDAGRDIAMQIAAMNPQAVDRNGVDSAVIERELEVAKEQIRNEGKPENMVEKIAQGKLNKFYKENTLLEQAYVKDGSISVEKFLDSVNKGMTVSAFKRVQIG